MLIDIAAGSIIAISCFYLLFSIIRGKEFVPSSLLMFAVLGFAITTASSLLFVISDTAVSEMFPRESLRLVFASQVVVFVVLLVQLWRMRKASENRSVLNAHLTEKIAELEVAQEELSASIRRSEAFSEAVSSITWYANPDGSFFETQPKWEEFTGLPWQANLDDITALTHPDDLSAMVDFWTFALKTRTNLDIEVRMWSSKLQEFRPMRSRAVPILNESNKIIEWVGAIEDISEQVAERDLFKTILRSSPVAMIVVGQDFQIELANAAAERMFKYESGGLLGKAITVLGETPISSEIRSRAQSTQAEKVNLGRTSGVSLGGEALCSDGSNIPVEVRLSSLEFYGEPAIIVAYTDLSELRDLVQKLEDRNQALEVSNSDLERFAYIASHDLREPARKVIGFSQLLKVELGDEISETAKQYLAFTEQSGKKMGSMIDDLLIYSRVRTEPENIKPIDLQKLAESLVEEQLKEAKLDGIAKVNISSLPTIVGNQTLLDQLFNNLISNAIKFQPEERSLVLDIEGKLTKKSLVISVSDNGCGIAEEHQHRVFNMFERLHGKSIDGNGLGLAICKRVMEEFKGSIDLTSQVDEGTTFILKFPIRHVAKG